MNKMVKFIKKAAKSYFMHLAVMYPTWYHPC